MHPPIKIMHEIVTILPIRATPSIYSTIQTMSEINAVALPMDNRILPTELPSIYFLLNPYGRKPPATPQ